MLFAMAQIRSERSEIAGRDLAGLPGCETAPGVVGGCRENRESNSAELRCDFVSRRTIRAGSALSLVAALQSV